MFAAKIFGLLSVLVSAGVLSAPMESSSTQRKPKEYEDDNFITKRRDCDCVCGMSNRQMRVVGGNITKIHEFPWLAGLSKNGVFFCGATLITKRHLLTAAHCVEGPYAVANYFASRRASTMQLGRSHLQVRPQSWEACDCLSVDRLDFRTITVALGDHDRKAKDRFATMQVRRIKKAKSHKLFDVSSYNNDISVLELDEPVEFDSKVQPACLPSTALVDYTGQMALVAGWGRTGEKEDTSTVLRKVAVPVWSKKQCYDSGYGEQRLSENMFCAGYAEGKKDACQGDSGGPLHVKNQEGNMEVIGVVSWGRGCARPNLPGIYTKVVNYLDWVEDSLDGECLCLPPIQNPRRA